MNPQVGDIWHWHHEMREEDAIVLIHEFLNETHNLAQKKVLVYWGYDMLTDQYDEWLFTEDTIDKLWKRVA